MVGAHSTSASVIHVFYGDLKPGQQSILEKVFRPKLSLMSEADDRVKVKETFKAKLKIFSRPLRVLTP